MDIRVGRWSRARGVRERIAGGRAAVMVCVAGLCGIGGTGCVATSPVPDLHGLYDRAAQEHDALRNPVIVIPGILGSRLRDEETGTVVWGAFAREAANPSTAAGARLAALPMQRGVALRELRDGVRPDGALDRLRVELLGLPFELNAYYHILGTLGAGGYRDQQLADAGAVNYGGQHFTCFQFAYDWRRDNVENAQRLHEFILERKAYVEGELARRYGVHDANVKFDIVAHSMGGLITRYYLRYGNADLPEDGSEPAITWAGAQHVRRAILVGTPNAGSAKALHQLVTGLDLRPVFGKYEPAVLGTMPSVYQLMTRPRHGAVVRAESPQERIDDYLEAARWERMGWGLAGRDQDRVLRMLLPEVADAQERRAIALEHLEKCLTRARRFAAALDRPAEPPSGLDLQLYAGDAVRTPATVGVDERTGSVRFVGWGPGDVTVLRTSAVMDERVGREWEPGLDSPIGWSRVTFLFTNHIGLTRDPVFADNVLFTLLESPRGGGAARISRK